MKILLTGWIAGRGGRSNHGDYFCALANDNISTEKYTSE